MGVVVDRDQHVHDLLEKFTEASLRNIFPRLNKCPFWWWLRRHGGHALSQAARLLDQTRLLAAQLRKFKIPQQQHL